jgi:ribosomal protein L7/L12
MDIMKLVDSLSEDDRTAVSDEIYKRRKAEARAHARPLNDSEKSLADNGEVIAAIKQVRIRLGLSLLDAKSAVDMYCEQK